MSETIEFVRINLEFSLELLVVELLFMKKHERSPHFVLRLIAALIAFAAISVLLSIDWFSIFWGDFGVMFHCLMILLLSVLGLRWLYQCTVHQAGMYAILAYTIQNIAFALHEMFKGGWTLLDFLPEYNLLIDILSYLVCFIGVYAVAYFLFIKQFSVAQADTETIRRSMPAAFGMLFVVTVLSTYCHEVGTMEMLLCRSASILGCVTSLGIILELFYNQKLRHELEFIQYESERRVNYYQQLKDNIEATNLRCHDIKHHLARLREEVHSSSDGLLNELEQAINIYDSFAKTGNEPLDIVLTEKGMICQREGIQFTYLVDAERIGVLSDKEIYSLFGNALDNAIEAVRKVKDPEKRVINLSVAPYGPVLIIQLHNYFDDTLSFKDGLPETTKKDKFLHGYGMKTIRMIAEKYDGAVLVSAPSDIFELSISIPLLQED